MNNLIGVTERADPTINKNWIPWVEKGKPAILITKMPRLLLPELRKLDSPNVIVHCTITGMGSTLLEPNIDKSEVSIDAYVQMCVLLGSDRVVLRVDPIFNPLHSTVYAGILGELEGARVGRMRISFLDLYPHVIKRLGNRIDIGQRTFHLPLGIRLLVWEYLGRPEVCAEPGLTSTPCVSDLDCIVLGVNPSECFKGQRRECRCLANKTELCRPPPKCTYGCLYCYWKG